MLEYPPLYFMFSITHSRVGLIQFSSTSETEIELASFFDRKMLEKKINVAKKNFKNKGFNAYSGIKSAIDMIKLAERRKNKVKIRLFLNIPNTPFLCIPIFT